MYRYDDSFQLLTTGSDSAARRIIAAVKTIVTPASVLDVGCARGTWLRAWQDAGCSDFLGIDGSYIDHHALEIEAARFMTADLNETVNLGRQFDLVECLEVAEHLPAARAGLLVADLVAHAPVVLFSAAPPGQGGENHVNEQPYAYWQALFSRHDYVAIDCLRPLLAKEPDMPHWYRYNLILYVRQDTLDRLPPFVRQFAVPIDREVPDVSPLSYRLRKLVIRQLPAWLCNAIARWNARRHARCLGAAGNSGAVNPGC
jgi:hypothetical protein